MQMMTAVSKVTQASIPPLIFSSLRCKRDASAVCIRYSIIGYLVFNVLPFLHFITCIEFLFYVYLPVTFCFIGVTLGQGAFGKVMRAEAIGLRESEESTVVAVKMVKGKEQKSVFLMEFFPGLFRTWSSDKIQTELRRKFRKNSRISLQ